MVEANNRTNVDQTGNVLGNSSVCKGALGGGHSQPNRIWCLLSSVAIPV
ncbi:MAG: hypothetical protein MRY64_11025 [Hyphomonadaceae bacterium]|nr:hypothetical protein [Hyphomonadaceae bacterium]